MKTVKYIVLLILALNLGQTSWANEAEEKEEHDVTKVILHHIADSHKWELPSFSEEHSYLYLPVLLWDGGLKTFSSRDFEHDNVVESSGEYYIMHHDKIYKTDAQGTISYDEKHEPTNSQPLDFSITKNTASLFFACIVLIVLMLTVSKAYRKTGTSQAPSGLQGFIEPLILFVRDEIAIPNIGHGKYMRYMPYLLTIFFFILLNNLLGLVPFIPGGANLSGNIAFTSALALLTFLLFTFVGNKNYWQHIFWMPGVPVLIRPILAIVEFVGMFVKPASLAIRLFANITGGHILVLSIVSLGIVFHSYAVGGASVLFTVFISLIELLVAFIQAFIFTLLSSIYIGQATDDGHH